MLVGNLTHFFMCLHSKICHSTHISLLTWLFSMLFLHLFAFYNSNSFLQFFKELNKINQNISAYKVQLTNAKRQANQENENEFKNDSNKTRKK